MLTPMTSYIGLFALQWITYSAARCSLHLCLGWPKPPAPQHLEMLLSTVLKKTYSNLLHHCLAMTPSCTVLNNLNPQGHLLLPVYIRRHSTTDAELQQFQALEAEAQKWKVGEKQLAEQLANLWKDWNCRMKSDHATESNQPRTPITKGRVM